MPLFHGWDKLLLDGMIMMILQSTILNKQNKFTITESFLMTVSLLMIIMDSGINNFRAAEFLPPASFIVQASRFCENTVLI